MKMSRRSKERINYKELHEGNNLPKDLFKKRTVQKVSVNVLPDTYSVERLISRRTSNEVILFLSSDNICGFITGESEMQQ